MPYVTLWPCPLTLNVYSISAVKRSNSVPNFSEIEQSAAELWRFNTENLVLAHIGFHGKCNCAIQ